MELENVIDIDVELEEADSIETDIKEAGPPGPKGDKGDDGLSAYQIYLNAGGTLSETEWLDSLRGENGKDGINGIDGKDGSNGEDGYTPIRGTDYWTEQDQQLIKNDLETYIDNQLGVIENAYY